VHYHSRSPYGVDDNVFADDESINPQTVMPSVDLMDMIIIVTIGSRTSAMSSFSSVDIDANKL